MKERVTVTLDRNLLKLIDSSVDGRGVKNRSHAMEILLHQALDGDIPRQAIVLGGATKAQIDAVLKPIHGKPVLVHNIELLSAAGIPEAVIISADPERIRDALGDSRQYDMELRYVRESSPMGTAGALHLARPYIDGPFILTNGDEFKEVNIKDMYAFHKEHAGLCTIALTTVPNPGEYGVALLNGNRIITFVEKPDKAHAPSNLISAGIYIMEPEVLDIVPNGYAKIEYDIFPKLAKEDRLYGYHFSGEYSDHEHGAAHGHRDH